MLGMLDKKDKVAALMMSVKPAEDKHEKEEVDMKSEAKKDAARQLLAAIEKKDLQAIVESLDMFRECGEGYEE